MQSGGRRDDRSIDFADERAVVGEGFAVAFRGDSIPIGRERIGDAHQIDMGILDQFLGMEAAKTTGSDDGSANFRHDYVLKMGAMLTLAVGM
jgi:hypothetical protein